MTEKNRKNNILLYVDIILNSNFNVHNKFYWNTNLLFVYVLFMFLCCNDKAEQLQHNTYGLQNIKYLLSWHLQKKFPALASGMVMLMPGFMAHSGTFHDYEMRN